MLEAKIILAMVLPKFNFVKVGFDGITQEEVYNVSNSDEYLWSRY